MSFTTDFIKKTTQALDELSVDDIDEMARVILQTKNTSGRIFFAGSGGGAGHASHAACDFRKILEIESYSISDNVSELTARVNDESWSSAYANWLRVSNLHENDCLFVISVGGGSLEPEISMNLVNAVEYAKSRGSKVVGIVGRDGGHLRIASDASVLIPQKDKALVTPITEGLQAVIWHLIVSHPMLEGNSAMWESTDE